jgi:molecular chaperone HtpG
MPDESEVHAFQVDLRGLVDLLSHHLYSSPRVFVRELLQNAVDAITARRQADPDAPAEIRITLDEAGMSVTDSGIGLTEADAHRFLATIGHSAKRDDLAGARREFLGQFGIGLLACFTVADQIRVVTRYAGDPAAPVVEWLARSDGTYGVSVKPIPETGAPAAGTTVYLSPRAGASRWFDPEVVAALARDYGSLLPYPVTVTAGGPPVSTTDSPPVWSRPYASARERRSALFDYGEQQLGFVPLDLIDLDLPLAGVRGVGYVLPRPANPAEGSRHRVYLKGMLLSDSTAGLLPDWAFFVRCVIDTDTLKPTASREALYEDETLVAVSEALGVQIRDWLTELAATEPHRLAAFLDVHALSVKALARHDRELLRLMLPYLRFESTDGPVTLPEFARNHPRVYVAPTVDEFRQVAPVASAQGIGVINGGYTYDGELVAALPGRVRPAPRRPAQGAAPGVAGGRGQADRRRPPRGRGAARAQPGLRVQRGTGAHGGAVRPAAPAPRPLPGRAGPDVPDDPLAAEVDDGGADPQPGGSAGDGAALARRTRPAVPAARLQPPAGAHAALAAGPGQRRRGGGGRGDRPVDHRAARPDGRLPGLRAQ